MTSVQDLLLHEIRDIRASISTIENKISEIDRRVYGLSVSFDLHRKNPFRSLSGVNKIIIAIVTVTLSVVASLCYKDDPAVATKAIKDQVIKQVATQLIDLRVDTEQATQLGDGE
jgi:hypothetical protein